jgi:hypothetical protein
MSPPHNPAPPDLPNLWGLKAFHFKVHLLSLRPNHAVLCCICVEGLITAAWLYAACLVAQCLERSPGPSQLRLLVFPWDDLPPQIFPTFPKFNYGGSGLLSIGWVLVSASDPFSCLLGFSEGNHVPVWWNCRDKVMKKSMRERTSSDRPKLGSSSKGSRVLTLLMVLWCACRQEHGCPLRSPTSSWKDQMQILAPSQWTEARNPHSW